MLNQLFQRLRGVRHLEWILAIFAVAALLIFVAGLSDGQPAENVSSLEARLERVLSAVEGAGEVRVMINEPEAAQAAFMSQDSENKPAGVLVVAQGAGDIGVSMELSRAVQALLGVDAASVEILKMAEENG